MRERAPDFLNIYAQSGLDGEGAAAIVDIALRSALED
jgi:hypothetical protein